MTRGSVAALTALVVAFGCAGGDTQEGQSAPEVVDRRETNVEESTSQTADTASTDADAEVAADADVDGGVDVDVRDAPIEVEEIDHDELLSEMRERYDEGDHLTIDELLVLVAESVPQFAGYYLDGGRLTIALAGEATDDRADAAVAAIAELTDDPTLDRNADHVEVDYAWLDLFGWMRTILGDATVLPINFYDIDEVENRIAIGVEGDPEDRDTVREHLEQLGVPGGALVTVESGPIVDDVAEPERAS